MLPNLEVYLTDELVQRTVEQRPAEPTKAVEEPTRESVDGRRPQALGWYGLVSLTASVLIQLINVASGILIARSLGPAGRGELTAIILWPGTLAAICSLGTTEALTYFTSRQPDRAAEIFATGIVLGALQAAAVIGIGYMLLPVLLTQYGSDVLFVSRLYLLCVPLTFAALVGAEVLRGRLAIVAYNFIRLLVVLTSLAGLLVLALLHRMTLMSIVSTYLSANLVTAFAAVLLLRAHGSLGLRASSRLARSILAFGLKSHAGNISLLVNVRADQALISLFLVPASLGFYSIAVSVTAPVTLIGISIAVVVLPAVGGCESSSEMKAYFARFVRATLALSTTAALFLWVLVPSLISTLFGRAFEPATTPAQFLLLAAVLMSASQVLTAGLNAFNKPLVPSLAQILSTVTIGIALIAFLPPYGIVGAAIAAALAHAVGIAYMVWYAIKRLDVPAGTFVPTASDLAWLWSTTASKAAAKFRASGGSA